jgi:hypothetical protein
MSILGTYGYDDLYQKMYTNLRNERPMWDEKSYVGGPEKQLILFVWPYALFYAL